MLKYGVILYWSKDDQAFLAEVPELPGCMADGKTYQEALTNVEAVMQQWIDTARESGRPIPEPKGRLIDALGGLVVIRVSAVDEAKACMLLIRHSPGVALPNQTYIVSKDAADCLREAGIRFSLVATDLVQ